MKYMLDMVNAHKAGAAVGIYSVCSANPLVIEAALKHALSSGKPALIEATSNQVNQYGGYTGMLPQDFRDLVFKIANKLGFPIERVILGGDHLGPNCWQDMPVAEAMSKSDELIAQYVKAGFKKIHLDCSMSCKGDPVPLTDEIVAQRAARLCAVAEKAWSEIGGEAPVYVIGTEVPVPGGAKEDLEELAVTSNEAALLTIQAHEVAFAKAGLSQIWQRVVGLVVQPGVEFDHHKVIDYEAGKALALSRFIESQPTLVYEAHSTDYQVARNLQELVRDHFAILKVGPGVTFALREAIWALDHLEQEWLGKENASHCKDTVLRVMRENPKYWRPYYLSEGEQLVLDCQYSLSDRIRYYWSHPEVESALATLCENLDNNPPPMTLLSQFMPRQFELIRKGELAASAREMIMDHVNYVLTQYSDAC